MLKLIFQRLLYTCAVRRSQYILWNSFVTSAAHHGGFKRYDRNDSVRQIQKEIVTPESSAFDKTYGASSFPTLETHSESFQGIKFTDLPIVHVKCTSNNTVISVTSGDGVVQAIQSSGTVGFRNAKKGTNVAAQAAAIALAGDALRKDISTVRVCLKGIGPGRLPALKALQLSGLSIISITDTTPLAHNGNRPKKARRL